MNRSASFLICLVVLLFSACSEDEPQTHGFVVAEFDYGISQTVIFQAANRAYVATVPTSIGVGHVTDVYRVDLLSGEKTLIFSTPDYNNRFIVSADEKFIAIGIYPANPSAESPSRLELFDLTTNTKTVLKTAEGFFNPFGFDAENNTLLFGKYGTNEKKIRTIDLTSGEETIISDEGSATVVAINPITSDILLQATGQYYFITWDGTVVGEPITGFIPEFFSPDGEELIGYRGVLTDSWEYQEVVRYTIATAEVESLTGTETAGAFYASSMSPDQNFVLGMVGETQSKFDLYVVNTETQKKNRLMSTREGEQAIGFFDAGRKALFTAPEKNYRALYGVKVD